MSGYRFNTLRLLNEWNDVEPLLREIVLHVGENLWPSNVPLDFSSIYRTITENHEVGAKSTVHVTEPHRAVDIRTRTVPSHVITEVVKVVNSLWIYDPERPEKPVAYAESHGTGPHIHIQVHANTRRR